MAHVSIYSSFVTQGVAGERFPEGTPVCISASGIHNELPTVMKATASTYQNIFVAIVPPDQYSKPVPYGIYKTPGLDILDLGSAVDTVSGGMEPWVTRGLSLAEYPIVESGMLLQLHRGGAYTVHKSIVVGDLVIGTPIGVDGSGMWAEDLTSPVGQVREVRGDMYVIEVK